MSQVPKEELDKLDKAIEKECASNSIYREVLFDFLRTLPKDYDACKITVSDAFKMIDDFMKTHGLK